jgi:hypothetical protein
MSEDNRANFVGGVAVGMASAAVFGLGVVMLYLLLRKNQHIQNINLTPQLSVPSLGLGYPQIPALPMLPTGSRDQAPVPVVQVSPHVQGSGPTMRTLTVSPASPTFLASASSVPVRVLVRPVAPVAGFVCLGYNASALQNSDFQSNGALIPVGDTETVRLLPGQQLYARAVTPQPTDVALVSVTRMDAPGDI